MLMKQSTSNMLCFMLFLINAQSTGGKLAFWKSILLSFLSCSILCFPEKFTNANKKIRKHSFF